MVFGIDGVLDARGAFSLIRVAELPSKVTTPGPTMRMRKSMRIVLEIECHCVLSPNLSLTLGTTSVEDVGKVHDGPKVFQLYVWYVWEV